MVWGSISMDGCTGLYRLDNCTIRYWDEILGPTVRSYTCAISPGFLLVHHNAKPHVARVCRWLLNDEGIDTTNGPLCAPGLNPVAQLWGVMFRSIQHCLAAPQTVHELHALVQIWQETPVRSMPRHCWAHTEVCGSHYQYYFELLKWNISKTDESVASVSHSDLRGPLNSGLCRLIILISINRCWSFCS